MWLSVRRGCQRAVCGVRTETRAARRYLHGVVGVFVVEDEGFLDELVVALQLVDLWLVVDDALLVLPQVLQLVLQRAVHLDRDAADLLQKHTTRQRRRGRAFSFHVHAHKDAKQQEFIKRQQKQHRNIETTN